MKILITGGTGFAGSHLVELLLQNSENEIHVTSINQETTHVHTLLPIDHIHAVDLTDPQATQTLIKNIQPDHVYHLAAVSSVGDSFDKAESVITTNAKLQISVLEAVRRITPKARLLIVGSALEYDMHQVTETIDENIRLGPANPYGVSKVMQDLLGLSYVYSYKLDIVRVRPFNHIGERQTAQFAIARFAQQIVAVEHGLQEDILVGNLEAIRDFTDVKDMVKAYVLLMEKAESSQVYNIGSGKGISIRDMLALLIKLSDTEITVKQDAALFRPVDVPKIVANIEAISALGWQPTIPIAETLKRILNYWRNQT